VALIERVSGRALGGGSVRSEYGSGELVVTESGLHACDLPSGEVVTLPWSAFARHRIRLGPPDGSSTLTFEVDGRALDLTLDSTLAAFVIGSSGRYWFHGAGLRRASVDLTATASPLPERRRDRPSAGPPPLKPADPRKVLSRPTGTTGDTGRSWCGLAPSPWELPTSNHRRAAGARAGLDGSTQVVRHRGHPLPFIAAATALAVIGLVAVWPSRPDPETVTVELDGPPVVPAAASPQSGEDDQGAAGHRGAAGAPVTRPTQAAAGQAVGEPDGGGVGSTSETEPAVPTPSVPPATGSTVQPPTSSSARSHPGPGSVAGSTDGDSGSGSSGDGTEDHDVQRSSNWRRADHDDDRHEHDDSGSHIDQDRWDDGRSDDGWWSQGWWSRSWWGRGWPDDDDGGRDDGGSNDEIDGDWRSTTSSRTEWTDRWTGCGTSGSCWDR
jgi:hypothetical protein